MNKLNAVNYNANNNIFNTNNTVSNPKTTSISFRTNNYNNELKKDTIELSDKNNKKRNLIITLSSIGTIAVAGLVYLHHKGHTDNKNIVDSIKDGWKMAFNKAEKEVIPETENAKPKQAKILPNDTKTEISEKNQKSKECNKTKPEKQKSEKNIAENCEKNTEQKTEETIQAKENSEVRKTAEDVESNQINTQTTTNEVKTNAEKIEQLNTNLDNISSISKLTTQEFESYINEKYQDPVQKELGKVIFRDLEPILKSMPKDEESLKAKISQYIQTSCDGLSDNEKIAEYTKLQKEISDLLNSSPDEFMNNTVGDFLEILQFENTTLFSDELFNSDIILKLNKNVKIKDLADFLKNDFEGWGETNFKGLIKELAKKDLTIEEAIKYFPDNFSVTDSNNIKRIIANYKLMLSNTSMADIVEYTNKQLAECEKALTIFYDEAGIQVYEIPKITDLYHKILNKEVLTDSDEKFIENLKDKFSKEEHFRQFDIAMATKIALEESLNIFQKAHPNQLYRKWVELNGNEMQKYFYNGEFKTSDLIKQYAISTFNSQLIDIENYNNLLDIACIIGKNPSISSVDILKESFAQNKTLLESLYEKSDIINDFKNMLNNILN